MDALMPDGDPGQPAERSGPLDSSTVAGQIRGETQPDGETPVGRGAEH